MNLPHHLQQHPSGTYYFRLVVPKRLQQQVGRKVIKQSLRTKNPTLAKWLAYVSAVHYLPQLRANMPIDLKTALEAARNGQRYEITTSDGTRVVADGVEDHNRAMEALAALQARRVPVTAPNPPSSGTVLAPAKTYEVSEIITKYLNSIKDTSLPKTLIGRTKSLEDFKKYIKPRTHIHRITRTDVAGFCEFLQQAENSKPTIALKVGYLKIFFTFAQAKGYYPEKDNPAEKQISYTKRDRSFRKKLGFEPFTSADISKIFSNLDPKKPQKYWPFWIGLYTGARVNEVAQLELKNFTEVEGIPCFEITDSGDTQRLKTYGSARTIPIHPKLISLGLLQYVGELKTQGETKLFPKLNNAINGYGNAVSKAFARILEELKIESGLGRKGFHSFRKTINHQMQTHKIAPDIRAQFLGHDLDDEHYQAYSRQYTVKELAETIFPALQF